MPSPKIPFWCRLCIAPIAQFPHYLIKQAALRNEAWTNRFYGAKDAIPQLATNVTTIIQRLGIDVSKSPGQEELLRAVFTRKGIPEVFLIRKRFSSPSPHSIVFSLHHRVFNAGDHFYNAAQFSKTIVWLHCHASNCSSFISIFSSSDSL